MKQRKILRDGDVRKRVPVGRVTLWRWERDGLFPKRIQIGPRAIGWYEDEVDAWVESRKN